ncbi:hypothetical protein Ga0100231_020460 [Opitutaceae bacterium TAV4]|nr:hypothetical protein Ga0100231_020460 [Opitutaceae bacterium TAV4]RRK00428.1 hypothetical protein Ga0100230_021305 [Opitutaceae bacterium TAV3]
MTHHPNSTSRTSRTSRTGVVNIINFIRGIEPRPGRSIDLIEPVVRQIELSKKHRLPVTWLVQYDAMIDPRFRDVLQTIQPEDEIGVWIEFVQPLVEKAGLQWRGRYPWDWHVNVGFSVGYTPDERIRMIDIFLKQFRDTFGFAPKAAGSWFIDAHSLAHLGRSHGIVAFCNCKDQWGTDGYTLWGGYFNQAYYPSRLNSFIPSQTADDQIDVPVFRMLGSDPIHQYEIPRGTGSHGGQAVFTLEAISRGGRDPAWIDRFFANMFETPCLTFGYTQVGQENSFGWPAMSKGLIYQHRRIAELRDLGRVRVETLSRSGQWFKNTYALTPPSAVVAEQDLNAPERGAVWYCSKNYRASLLWDGRELRLRDIQLFDGRREEPFLRTVCHESACKYDALPVIDGFQWSDANIKAALRIIDADGEPLLLHKPPQASELDRQTLHVRIDDRFAFTFGEDSFAIQGPAGVDWTLAAAWSPSVATAFLGAETNRLRYRHEGHAYSVALLAGSAKPLANGFALLPDASGLIRFSATT